MESPVGSVTLKSKHCRTSSGRVARLSVCSSHPVFAYLANMTLPKSNPRGLVNIWAAIMEERLYTLDSDKWKTIIWH